MTYTLMEIRNCDDELAELYLRSALEQVQFITKFLVDDLSVEPHDEARGIVARITTSEIPVGEYLKAVVALIHAQCPENKSINVKYSIDA